jgi:Raf kinase inhibitor-like YbhB/YbcL family protein
LQQIGGQNMSPELQWGPGPQGTMSYALVLHDYSNGFTHWALWNISLDTLMLPANLSTEPMPATPAGSSQIGFGDNSGYAGPGADDHVYELRLYALNIATFTPDNASEPGPIRAELENNEGNFVLGTTDLRGVTPP